jgi:hypothetical protein
MVGKMEFWLRYRPNGCVAGYVRIDEVKDMGGAQKFFVPDAAKRRQEILDGWKYVMVDQGKLRNATGCLQGRCSHKEWP